MPMAFVPLVSRTIRENSIAEDHSTQGPSYLYTQKPTYIFRHFYEAILVLIAVPPP